MYVSLFFCIFLGVLIYVLFFIFGKNSDWDIFATSSFECGFSSYFFSRFSFSIHYFLVALLFLFLDLELCVVMPSLCNLTSSFDSLFNLFLFVLVLLVGLILEWSEKKLDWVF